MGIFDSYSAKSRFMSRSGMRVNSNIDQSNHIASMKLLKQIVENREEYIKDIDVKVLVKRMEDEEERKKIIEKKIKDKKELYVMTCHDKIQSKIKDIPTSIIYNYMELLSKEGFDFLMEKLKIKISIENL